MRPGALFAAGLWAAAAILDGALLAFFLRRPADAEDPGGATETSAQEAEAYLPRTPAAAPSSGDTSETLSRGTPLAAENTEGARSSERGTDLASRSTVKTGPLAALVHTVASGDTLIGVARGYLGPGADWRAVAAENSLESPYLLQLGRELRISAVKVARTVARIELVKERRPTEENPSATAGPGVNPPPGGAFALPDRQAESPRRSDLGLEPGLRLVHPLREAFPWGAIAAAGAILAAAAGGAGASALSGLRPPVAWGGAVVSLALGAISSAGAAGIWGGVSVLMAAHIARSRALQLVWAAASGAACGAAGGFGAWLGPLADARSRTTLARRFGIGIAVACASALAVASLAGWTGPALESLRLPG